MIYKALASAIMANVLSSAKKDVVEMAKAQLMSASMENARKALNAHVAERYSKEVEYNVSQYIRALGAVEAEISFAGKPGEALIVRAESAVKQLEVFLESQNPDGPVIQYLKKRYDEEGIRIITGRLYAGHYVGTRGQGIYEVANRMGYAANVDRRKPWLSSPETRRGIESMVADEALRIFDEAFSNIDLSGELALLTPSGGKGFKSPGGGDKSPPPKTSSGKKKKKKKR